MQDFQTILLSVIGTVITALLSWGVERLVTLLNNHIKNKKALESLTKAVQIVEASVKATYQTYVESLKGQNLFNNQAQTTALEKAKEMAINTLSAETKAFIESNFGVLNGWLELQIENTLYNLKHDNKSTKNGEMPLK